MVRVYIDGVWDLGPHVAHLNYMQHVRTMAKEESGDDVTLIVGVISDADTASYKRTPIVNEAHRAQAVGAVRFVDKVVPNAPLVLTESFLEEHAIDLVFHGDDSQQEEFFGVCIAKGIMRYIPYDVAETGVSTTALIERVARYYYNDE